MSRDDSIVCSAYLTLGQSGIPRPDLQLQLARKNRRDHLHSETPDNEKYQTKSFSDHRLIFEAYILPKPLTYLISR